MQELGALGLPKLSIDEVSFSTDYEARLAQLYFPVLEKMPIGKQVIVDLSRDSRVLALSDKMIACGMVRVRFQIKMLALWYLWYANEYGSEQAQRCLDSFLNAKSIPVTRVLWVLGMGASKPVTVKGDYVIRPIHDMPDSSQKERFIQNTRHFFPTRSPVSQCAVTRVHYIEKATLPSGPVDKADAQKLSDIDRRMEEIAWLLNALDGICCVPFVTSGHAEPNIPFGPFGGRGAMGRMLDVLSAPNTTLPDRSTGLINDLLDDYDRLDETERTRIRRILSRLSQAKRGLQIEDKMLDLGIAMEMLLLEDNTNREQLALAFRLRGSWLLGSSPGERHEIYHCLKEVYRYRSEVAHSGMLHQGDPVKMHLVGSRFPKYQSLAERTVRKIMKDGKPDWDSLIIGAV